MIGELNGRSREILRHVIESFVETGEPVGSRTLSRRMGMHLSPATIRNAMADLEELGLLYAPHTSAGRLPTDRGLRLFVDGILEIGDLSEAEREAIEVRCAASGRSFTQVLDEASRMVSGLSQCAGLVVAPKSDDTMKHIEFVSLGPGRALVVMVTSRGMVENRIIDIPFGMPPSALVEAGNFMSNRLLNRSLVNARSEIEQEIEQHRVQLDALTSKVVEAGMATWSNRRDEEGVLIVHGQASLLQDVTAVSDLERIRSLFEALEAKEGMLRLIDATEGAEGVQIFIGAENELFSVAGCSIIIAPFADRTQQIVGAIGVVGPTRLNYARIIPMVDYTAKVVGRLIG